MTKSKKKRIRNLILLFLAVILIIVAYIVLIKFKERDSLPLEDTTVEAETLELLSLEEEDIASITIKNSSGEMAFTKNKEDVIVSKEDELLPINQSYGSNLYKGVSNLTATKKLSEQSISEYGLDNPSIIVTLHMDDGTIKVLKFGNEVPITGGYYTMLEGDSNVYICNATSFNYYNYSIEEMTSVETLPSIAAENITHMKVVNKNGQVFEAEYDETSTNDFANMIYWTIKEPYEINLPGDSTELTNLFNKYGSLCYLSLVDYSGSYYDKFGLLEASSRIEIDYYELKESESESAVDDTTEEGEGAEATKEEKLYHSFTLLIGDKNAEGNYYVKELDSTKVYTMDGETVEELLEVKAFPYVYKFVNLVNIEDVEEVELNFNNQTYRLSIKRETIKDGENESTSSTYYVDGKEVEEGSFKDFYQELISTKYDREIVDEANSTRVVLGLVYHLRNNKVISIDYLEYDESYYMVEANGRKMFLTDRREVDSLKEKLAALIDNKVE